MNIQEQIEALTQELRPYPNKPFYYFEASEVQHIYPYIESDVSFYQVIWRDALYTSTNKAEVEDYADCYRRLKLYQLLGEKAAKEYPIDWNHPEDFPKEFLYGTDFNYRSDKTGMVVKRYSRTCVLGGVWFAREEDRLKALEICGIDKAFQERCAKYGLGGA